MLFQVNLVPVMGMRTPTTTQLTELTQMTKAMKLMGNMRIMGTPKVRSKFGAASIFTFS